MADTSTNRIVDDVQTTIRENQFNSDAKAYRKLFESAQNAHQSEQSLDSQAVKDELMQRGLLPDLCIGYLKENFLKLDKDSDGKVTGEELGAAAAESTKRVENQAGKENKVDNKQSEINQMLLRELKKTDKLFELLADSRTVGDSREGIEMEDLLAHSKERLQSVFKEQSRSLLDDGAQSWMAYLDEKDGQFDGHASAQDIRQKAIESNQPPSKILGYNSNGNPIFEDAPTIPAGPVLLKAFRALASGRVRETVEDRRFLKDLNLGSRHQNLLRDGALDVVDIMRRSGLNPIVINSREDYESIKNASRIDSRPVTRPGTVVKSDHR